MNNIMLCTKKSQTSTLKTELHRALLAEALCMSLNRLDRKVTSSACCNYAVLPQFLLKRTAKKTTPIRLLQSEIVQHIMHPRARDYKLVSLLQVSHSG